MHICIYIYTYRNIYGREALGWGLIGCLAFIILCMCMCIIHYLSHA